MSIDDTRRAYDQFPDREWMRLEGGAQARLEYLITSKALKTHLPLPERRIRVLDAGGGPGRYTIDLAMRGYEMTLFDLSPNLLDVARSKIKVLDPVARSKVVDIVEGTITDLSRFPGNSFDAVLCLGGPLSHLTNVEDRRAALKEFRRALEPGGLLFLSVPGKFGAYRSAAQWLDWFEGGIPAIVDTGVASIGPGRAPAHFMTPDEFRFVVESAGFGIRRVYGCQGIGAHLHEETLLTLMDDPVRWPAWRDQLLATCDDPSVIGVSSHLLTVAGST